MKSSAKSSLYFSAYPLKAISEPTRSTGTGSPYLRSVLAGTGNIKTSSRVRVFPMANPYKPTPVIKSATPAKDIEASGDEWFNHYE